MILSGVGINEFGFIMVGTLLLVILDTVVTFLNSRAYNNYYVIELLPWNRVIYRYIRSWIGAALSFVFNLVIFILVFLLPVSISYMLIFTGFMVYRTTNSIVRFVQYWRFSSPRE